MKTITVIAVLSLAAWGADTYDKIYDRYITAETINNYLEADETMVIMSTQEFGAQPQDFQDQFANYGAYRLWAKDQINAGKGAMRDQLEADRVRLIGNPNYTPAEITQYRAELEAKKALIKDLTEAKSLKINRNK